jgi:hypothetical protein
MSSDAIRRMLGHAALARSLNLIQRTSSWTDLGNLIQLGRRHLCRNRTRQNRYSIRSRSARARQSSIARRAIRNGRAERPPLLVAAARRVRSGLSSKGPSPLPAPRNVICAKADLAVTARCAANVASHRNCLGFSRFATSALAPDGAELTRQ